MISFLIFNFFFQLPLKVFICLFIVFVNIEPATTGGDASKYKWRFSDYASECLVMLAHSGNEKKNPIMVFIKPEC